MWTARIVLLVTELLLAGGWFDPLLGRRKKRLSLAALPVLSALSFVPPMRETFVHAYAAPCAFLLSAALLCPTDRPIGALLAAAFSGIAGWKLIDSFPLFFEPGLLIALPAIVFSLFYCRDANAKALAIAAAPFVMLFCRAVGDYTLFNSAVLELGNGDALCAQAVGLLLLLAGGALVRRFPVRLKAVKQGGGDQRGQRYGKDQPDAARYAGNDLVRDVIAGEDRLDVPVVILDQDRVIDHGDCYEILNVELYPSIQYSSESEITSQQ